VDLAQLLFVWVVFLGADRALQTNNHIGVDFFVNFLPRKFKKFIYIIHYLFILLFLSGIIYYGFDLTISNFSRNFSTLGISYSYATAAVPVGCLLMFRTIIYKFITNDILSSESEQKDLI
ncbi:MAG: TRAP transporter small permease, partial [Halanaerobiales bacterium]|nr:TRAP transporter small permease [Halanaerobiales bacterium]